MAFQGIDIRQTGDRLVFRTLLQDSSGDLLATGTTTLKLYELQNDGTLKSYDFNDNTFKTTALTTETASMTHRQGNNATTNTGVWTYALTTLSGFTAGNLYLAMTNNTGASPKDQQREFQFGVSAAFNPFDGANGGMTTLADWADGGRLDLILDIIAADVVNIDGAAMRGTDSAALAATALSNAVWTDAKAGYIPAGLMPTQAEVLAIQNNTRVRVIVPPVIERPDAGSTTYRLWLYLYDTAGNMEAPDSLPTVTAQNNTGTDRSSGLSAVTNPSTGVYYADYTVASTHAIEGLLFQWSVVEGGATRTHGAQALVVDTTAVDFTAADRTKLDRIDTDYTTARAAKIDNLDAAISTRSTYAGADTAGTTTLLGRCTELRLAELDPANLPADVAAVKSDSAAILVDTGADGVVVASASKSGYALASSGFDSIAIEADLNARQALAIIVAGAAGVLAGAATTTITIAAAGTPATNRITATVDVDGNRSSVTLSAPA